MPSLKAQPAGIVRRTTDMHFETLAPHLCYMCHTTLVSKSSRGAPSLSTGSLRRSDGLVPLPVWANALLRSLHTASQDNQVVGNGEVFEATMMDQNAMRNALEGFLLSDD
jgi:cytoplasmic tRNA 2-thiolation protein 2